MSVTVATGLPAQTLTTLHIFDGTDGSFALSGLVQGTDGSLYGTTYLGGASNDGTVFKMTPGGMLTTLHSFCTQSGCPDGEFPYATLVQTTSGDFYGTANRGGRESGAGTIFKMALNGTLTTLHRFDGADGFSPVAGLVQGTNRDFYGTTSDGGANGFGTVFTITRGGRLTTLYSFCA